MGSGSSLFPDPAGEWFLGLCRVERRSAAGEWLLWFALGGGPPDFWKVSRPSCGDSVGACVGRGSGSATRHRSHGLSVRLCLVAAVDDDLFDLTCRVSPEHQLFPVVPVGLAG